MSAPRAGGGCAGHPWLSDETRQLAEQLLDHVEPWVQRLRDGDPEAAAAGDAIPATCGWCPLCAIAATLRGERPELAVRFAEHAAGLLATARQVLAEQPPAAPGSAEPAGDRVERVQRIDVQRPGAAGPAGC